MSEEIKIKLIKFGSPQCGHCVAMDKVKTFERFKEKHPEVEIVRLEILMDPDDLEYVPDQSEKTMAEYAKNAPIVDDYDVQAFPTLLWEREDGTEIFREAGGTSLRGLEKQYELAKQRAPAKGKAKK